MSEQARIKIYTTRYCGYCHAAKALLERKGVAFEEVDATDDPSMRQEAATLSGRRTVPQIFIDGRSIGGFDDLNALDRSGELDRLLAAP
ncbi:MAG: glutaredoxin 3 [Deltaproteobacteria bacterium]|nr:glutaredoxin 3 [Deltaproteobacteria bacterium]